MSPQSEGGASSAWRGAMAKARGPEPSPAQGRDGQRSPAATKHTADYLPKGPPEPQDEWLLVDDGTALDDEARRAVSRATKGGKGGRPTNPTYDEDADETVDPELVRLVGKALTPSQRARVESRLKDASRAFRAERYGDAARILKSMSEQAPTAAAVRELYGLTLYRQGKWKLAAVQLEAFRALTGSSEQNPVLADCYRALRRWNLVEELWAELREASPSAELVTEGRIVAAGALADQGQLSRAIAMLSQNWRFPKRAQEHHLRRAYVLADLYERAGEVPRARDLFARIAQADPDFADALARARSLR